MAYPAVVALDGIGFGLGLFQFVWREHFRVGLPVVGEELPHRQPPDFIPEPRPRAAVLQAEPQRQLERAAHQRL